MAKQLTIDEIHLTLRIPGDLPDDEVEAIRQTLADEEFMRRLRRAVRASLRALPELTAVRASLTR
jgi:hypothetical protein